MRSLRACEEGPVKIVNVIGCGSVGKTLSRLWTEHRVFHVRCVLNRSPESARRAVEFVGSGRAVADYPSLEPADLVMISALDEAIAPCCRQLCETGIVREGVVVFHCSGSLPSTLLEPASARGARVASVHPVKSFADPARAVESFAGTFCALEGDPQACDLLGDALARVGATAFTVDPRFKPVYHAGTVFACNYLIALVEIALRCFSQAGIARETAVEILRPIVHGTVGNVFELGPARALTGPIARGETSVVARQLEALDEWDESIRCLYQRLGRIATDLSASQGNAAAEALDRIKELLTCGE
jgi:predicted short-subunit dehydrogenase-like oxidoreductase (DUF2520 family)